MNFPFILNAKLTKVKFVIKTEINSTSILVVQFSLQRDKNSFMNDIFHQKNHKMQEKENKVFVQDKKITFL